MAVILPSDRIFVSFSCGAASAVAAKRTLEKNGDYCHVEVYNIPIAEEDEDNRRFLKDVEEWLGVKIRLVTHPNWPTSSAEEIWEHERFMSSPYGAPCTKILKKEARQYLEGQEHIDWHVLGFTADEVARHERFVLTERDNLLPVLIEDGLTKADCASIVREAGINLPRAYSMGYPNANCIGCVKATSPTYWNLVRKRHPETFERRASQSRRLGARLARYKGERVFLDELPSSAKGKPLKTLDLDCGIFCEEKPRRTTT